MPVVEFREATDAGIITDSGRPPIEDVVTIDSGCATSNAHGKLRPSNLLFVIDRSGSMACNLPEDGQSTDNCASFPARLFPNLPSKWDLTKSAVLQAISELRDAGTVRLGLSVFPKTGSQCTVTTEPEVDLALLNEEHQNKITDTLERLEPAGETPLAGATILGYAHLLEEMKTSGINGETFVVVVTDGYETCKPDELPKLTTQDVPNAFRQLGIRTFVIGAPGSDDGRYLLSQIAIAGGTRVSSECRLGAAPNEGNCHYDMTQSGDFARDLLAALLKVNAEVLACTLEIPSVPGGGEVNLEEVNVIVNGESRPMNNEGSCSKVNGWRYSSDFTAIQLCGDTCRAAKQRGAEVTVILGCPTLIQ
jgi:hypothetical protein